MRQDAQKQSQKFCRSKEDKNGETHPVWAEKGETGCVLGAGESSSGWRRMRADGKGRSEQGRGGRLLLSLAKMEGRTCLACRLGCCSPVGSAQHRPRREPRPVRNRAPLALARPSARGFGVDVGTNHQERERAGVSRFLPQARKRAVLVWCCELFLEKDCVSTTTSSFERKAPPPGGWPS